MNFSNDTFNSSIPIYYAWGGFNYFRTIAICFKCLTVNLEHGSTYISLALLIVRLLTEGDSFVQAYFNLSEPGTPLNYGV